MTLACLPHEAQVKSTSLGAGAGLEGSSAGVDREFALSTGAGVGGAARDSDSTVADAAPGSSMGSTTTAAGRCEAKR